MMTNQTATDSSSQPNQSAGGAKPEAGGSKERTESNRSGQRGSRRSGRKERKPRAEYQQKIISIRRVTRVMRGGRRFGFSVSLVIGDKKGKVGVGMAKAGDTALAIEKAYNQAKRNLITPNLRSDMSVPHDVRTRFASSEILIKPAAGKGVVAGSTVRNVLDLAGVNDVSAKILSRSKNPFNNAKAAIQALTELKPVRSQEN